MIPLKAGAGETGNGLEPEVCEWLDSLSDSDYKRVDEVAGMLAEEGTGLDQMARS